MNSIQPDELDECLRAHGLSLDDLVIEISSQHSVGLWWHPGWVEWERQGSMTESATSRP